MMRTPVSAAREAAPGESRPSTRALATMTYGRIRREEKSAWPSAGRTRRLVFREWGSLGRASGHRVAAGLKHGPMVCCGVGIHSLGRHGTGVAGAPLWVLGPWAILACPTLPR